MQCPHNAQVGTLKQQLGMKEDKLQKLQKAFAQVCSLTATCIPK